MGKINVKKVLPDIDKDLKITMVIIGSFAAFILLYLSLIGMGGEAGNVFKELMRNLLGMVSFIFPLIFLVLGIVMIRIQQNPESDFKKQVFNARTLWGFVFIVLTIATMINIVANVQSAINVQDRGGMIGFIIYPGILKVFGPIGAFVLIGSLGFYGFFLISQLKVARFIEITKDTLKDPKKFWDLIPDVYEIWKEEPAEEQKKDEPKAVEAKSDEDMEDMISSVIYDGSFSKGLNIKEKEEDKSDEANKIKEFIDVVISKPVAGKSESSADPAKNKPTFTATNSDDGEMVEMKPKKKVDNGTWQSPPTNLLKISSIKTKKNSTESEKIIHKNQSIIKDTLEHFGIKVTMGDTFIGPTVTQYTLKPANGVRLSTIDGLQRDLALALASPSIRIEAPIAGKSLVGIEIPNEKKSPVRLGDIIYHDKFQDFQGDLPIVIGKDVSGKELVYSLAKAPHLLVAGATGAGKSVWINGMLLSLMSKYSPYDLQLIMVDMKRVELKLYEGIPHLMCSVITEADKAINALKWTVLEMDRRYSLLEKHGKRNINDYNEFVKGLPESEESKPPNMPYMVFVIDELGDLMMIAKSEVEPIIVRLTQMSRAVGIHLVLGTQRPDTNVVTGLIKANVPTRIAFTVASQIDSRVILDTAGAEKLLGMGDGLISTPSLMKPIRFQGPFVEESEVTDHVHSSIKQAEEVGFNNLDDTITATPKTKINVPGMSNAKQSKEDAADEAYNEAKKIVVSHQKASTSFLQQTMGVGYPKAAKLINKLEQNGVVGPQNGSKPRDVYILPEELDEEE